MPMNKPPFTRRADGNFRIPRPEHALDFTGERMTSTVGGQIEFEHYHRYCMARDLCHGLDVLDVASGEGYGSALLAAVARTVVGVEIDAGAVAHAQANYLANGLRYLQGDAHALPIADASVDMVVSFETLEHLSNHEGFIAEVRRVLRPGGLFIVSTPDRNVYSALDRDPNPYHVQELTPPEFGRLLQAHFARFEIFYQRPILGSVMVSQGLGDWRSYERRSADILEATDGLPRADYLIGVATDGEMPPLFSSTYIDRRRVHALVEELERLPPISARAAELAQEVGTLREEYGGLQRQFEHASSRHEQEYGGLLKRLELASTEHEKTVQEVEARTAREVETRVAAGKAQMKIDIERLASSVESYRSLYDAATKRHDAAVHHLSLLSSVVMAPPPGRSLTSRAGRRLRADGERGWRWLRDKSLLAFYSLTSRQPRAAIAAELWGMRLIENSGLFFPAYYLSQSPVLGGRTPLQHYYEVGWRSGFRPNPLFDSAYYLDRNPDVAAAGVNPLVHFIRSGATELRAPGEEFDCRYYVETYPDVAQRGINPLMHFLTYGAREGRRGMVPLAEATAHAVPVASCDLRRSFLDIFGQTEIFFPAVENPRVSVIIPAYKGLEDLLNCLRSLAAFRLTEPSFEIIIVDDCPAAPVNQDIPSSPGLIKLSNEENLGFLLTCNRGASVARGEYLCFLNSDTIVTPRWLATLVEALEDDPQAGLTGCMLLNVDGTIQDAGWRILQNGWGEPIGRNASVHDGAYNYRRETDCVTGACFVTPTALFRRMNGLDTLYVPAFYEEFDYAFRARQLGMRTVYEPRSRVVHLGSTSYGAERRDQLSQINHAKFIERYASILKTQPAGTEDEYILRNPGTAPLLLVVDYAVPRPDRHAGDVTMLQYLSLLREIGWRVVYAPANGKSDPLATERLGTMGIEILHGPVTLAAWLRQNGALVKEVLLARPEIASRLIALVRSTTSARISYYTHDLHYLRLMRQAETEKSAEVAAEAKRMKETETAIFSQVDCVLSPSRDEAEIISGLAPGRQVEALLPYFFREDDIRAYDAPHFAPLSSVLFVGGFPHLPNVDAALFIAQEIMPRVWARVPSAHLVLAGYAPPPQVRELAGERVTVTGQVPSLDPYYADARVVLAALRYGGGVKGKVVEAMRMGAPVVSTTVGAEGIGIVDGRDAVVADDAEGLAAAVVSLLEDADRCAALSAAGADLIRQRFSRGAAKQVFERIFRAGA